MNKIIDDFSNLTSSQMRSYYRHKDKDHLRSKSLSQLKYLNNMRLAVIRFLGGKCSDPYNQHILPYSDVRALQIDHINGGGTKESKSICRSSMYRNILSGAKGYQILCANCNQIKKSINNETTRKYVEVRSV
jgi:hypothetical protein